MGFPGSRMPATGFLAISWVDTAERFSLMKDSLAIGNMRRKEASVMVLLVDNRIRNQAQLHALLRFPREEKTEVVTASSGEYPRSIRLARVLAEIPVSEDQS